jgi:TRAP-type uncharacterized transport system fused permease subunit
VLSPNGEGVLLQASPGGVALALVAALAAVAALAVLTGGWLIDRAGWVERTLAAVAAALLLYLEPVPVLAGFAALGMAVLAHQLIRIRTRTEDVP